VNRDEFFARPTRECHWWDDHPQILAGRDAEAGGTWLGLTRDGRVAVLTNFTERDKIPDAPSRGELPVGFLAVRPHSVTSSRQTAGCPPKPKSIPAPRLTRVHPQPRPRPRPLVAQDPDRRTPAADLADLAPRRDEYNGFNLLVGDCRTLEFAYLGNRGEVAEAPPSALVVPKPEPDDGVLGAVFGLSNATLDHPWPKVLRGKASLREEMSRAASRAGDGTGAAAVDAAAVIERVLENRGAWTDAGSNSRADGDGATVSSDSGSSLAGLPSPFVRPGDAADRPGYGTRCSTVIVVDADGAGATVTERSLDAERRAWRPDTTTRVEFSG
jgi:uncharacterized protein with NRDE domain